jgi:hypothetical protein
MAASKRHSIEDAIADMSEPPPRDSRSRANPGRAAKRKGKKARDGEGGEYLHLYGPLGFIKHLAERRALPALALLLMIHRHQVMQQKAKVALSQEVWEDAGNPSRQGRATLMAHLRRLAPDLIVIHDERTPGFRYRIEKGSKWRALEKAGQAKK